MKVHIETHSLRPTIRKATEPRLNQNQLSKTQVLRLCGDDGSAFVPTAEQIAAKIALVTGSCQAFWRRVVSRHNSMVGGGQGTVSSSRNVSRHCSIVLCVEKVCEPDDEVAGALLDANRSPATAAKGIRALTDVLPLEFERREKHADDGFRRPVSNQYQLRLPPSEMLVGYCNPAAPGIRNSERPRTCIGTSPQHDSPGPTRKTV